MLRLKMQPPSPTWETDYRHDRRKHRHRCRCCNLILNNGDRVLMARIVGHRSGASPTRAIHIACADTVCIHDWTWRKLFEEHGKAYLRACGWNIPEAA